METCVQYEADRGCEASEVLARVLKIGSDNCIDFESYKHTSVPYYA